MPIPPLKKVLGESPDQPKQDAPGLKRRKSNIHGPEHDPHVTGQNRRNSHIHGPDHDQNNPKDESGLKRRQSHIAGPGHEQDAAGLKRRQSHVKGPDHQEATGLKRRQSHVKGPGHEQDATGLKRRQSHFKGPGHDHDQLKRRPTHGPITGPPQKHGKKIDLQKKMQPGKLQSETKNITQEKTEEKDKPTAEPTEGNEAVKGSGPRPVNLAGQFGKDKGWGLLGSALKNRNRRESAIVTTAKELAELGGDGFSEIMRNLLKQKLIIFFIPCLAAGIAMFIKLEELGNIVGIPPTQYASESYNKCWTANALFIGIVVYGFIILALRVSSIANGILYLFIVTVVFNLALNSASRCYYFYTYDNFESVLSYIETTNKVLQKEKANHDKLVELFRFFDHIQTEHKCCGWDDVDILQSWPLLLSDPDDKKKKYYLPKSCCRDKCMDEMEKITFRPTTGNILDVATTDIIKFPRGTFMDIQTTAKVLSRQDLRSIRSIMKGEPPQLKPNGVTFKDKIKDTNTYLQILDYTSQTQLKISGGEIYWDVSHEETTATTTTKRIYSSKGIYRNDKEKKEFEKKFWTKSCEKISDPEKELEKKLKQSDFPLRGKEIYKYQTFFMDIIREHVFYYAIYSSAMILMIALLTWIFWHYYALLKAEELTDLGYPPDFDLLDLHLQGYEDEESTKKQKEKMKNKKLANKKKGNFQKEMVSTLRSKLQLARRVLARKKAAHAAHYHNVHHPQGHHPHDVHHPEGHHPHDAHHPGQLHSLDSHHPDFHHPTEEIPHAHEDHMPPYTQKPPASEIHQNTGASNPQAAAAHKLPAETLKPPATHKKTEAHNLHPAAHKKTEARHIPPAKKTEEHKPPQFTGSQKGTDKAFKPPDAKKKL